jgi:EAL and modified HD-GYP domain-containing signal transduction protein
MNAPERIQSPLQFVFDSLAICYAPLVDRKRRAVGTRLTLVNTQASIKPSVGEILGALNEVWPDINVSLMVAPLDNVIDESVEHWSPPKNAVLEIPGPSLNDPDVQALVQRLFRDGKRLALRGRSDTPLPPALLACFEAAVIHISEDRRTTPDGKAIVPSEQVRAMRRMPFVITGVNSVADVEWAYERGAVASVGWPRDDSNDRALRSLQPGQSVIIDLIRLVQEDAPAAKIDAVLKRDPALAFKLLRLVNSAAFGLPVQVTSFQHAVMMLGYKRLMRWLSLLLATASKEVNTFPLMHASLRRGLFLEKIGAIDHDVAVRDELFITGAFSMLDRITGAGFEHLFGMISLPEAVVDAVTRREGPYAPYLNLIESIEDSDPIGIVRELDGLAMPVAPCNDALLKALYEANIIENDL